MRLKSYEAGTLWCCQSSSESSEGWACSASSSWLASSWSWRSCVMAANQTVHVHGQRQGQNQWASRKNYKTTTRNNSILPFSQRKIEDEKIRSHRQTLVKVYRQLQISSVVYGQARSIYVLSFLIGSGSCPITGRGACD